MKKLILAVTIAFLSILACKKKEETPAPAPKKYEYKRTPGEVTKIEGDIFVDTGGTVFTVKGKGFDPSKKKYYHLLLTGKCNISNFIKGINGYIMTSAYSDTARLVTITDSTIKFQIDKRNIYHVRDFKNVGTMCPVKDTVDLVFAVTSKDSTNLKNIITKFDIIKNHSVRNKLFFNILTDTLHWRKNYEYSKVEITLDDIRAGSIYGNMVQVYFNNKLLNSGDISTINFTSTLDESSTYVGDCFFMFQRDFYNLNKSTVPGNGFYNITMKETKTGLPIEEKHGKKGVYVKFVD